MDADSAAILGTAAAVATVEDLAELLRLLRRRHARQRGDSPLTYRELAARTGWSHGSIGGYFIGRVLPPTDRFDALVQLLGAAPHELGAFAEARDRVEEQARPVPAEPPVLGTVPRQLPAGIVAFTGRAAALAELDEVLTAGGGGALVIGTAGVGKTTLAVHWGHRVADRFPDGQLHANLRGFGPGGREATPEEVLRVFLDALGVAPQRMPADLDALTGLYRSLLTGRRLLVVLDNAATAEQVRPLLPGAPGSLALITSRNQLTGLVASGGVRPVVLDLPSAGEARELLGKRLGAARLDADPVAAETVVEACARLPLALVIVAARGAVNPRFSLADLAGELRSAQRRDGLAALHSGDAATDVRSVFSWSYQRLEKPAADLFRLLALVPGPDVGEDAAAGLAGSTPAEARQALAELAHASLLTEPVPGRYTGHDLLRAYAGELSRLFDGDAERAAATDRLLDHYLHTGHAAALLLDPHRAPITPPPSTGGVGPVPLRDEAEALAWFAAEHAALLAAVQLAAATGRETHAWQLAWTMVDFLDRRGHWNDWVTVHTTALRAAERTGHPDGAAVTGHQLARACIRLGRYDDAHRHLAAALESYGRLGDDAGRARVHGNFSFIADRQGRHRDGIEHLRQSLALLRTTGDQAGQGAALSNLGWAHANLGEHREALAHCHEALELQRRIDDRPGEAYSWDSLGYIHHQLGEHAKAADCYRQALRIWIDTGDRYCEAETLTHLGDLHRTAADEAAARTAWQAAVTILDELDHPDAAQVRSRLQSTPTP